MIPRISHLIEHDCAPLFVTTDGVVGAIGQIRIIDSEMSGAFEQQDRIRRWLKAVSPSLTMRFIREIKNGSITDGMSERISAVENIGFLTQEIYLSIECRGSIQAIKEIKTFLGLKHSSLDNQVLEVVGAIDQLRQNGANFTFLKSNEVEKQFFWSRYPGFRVCASHLETGLEKVGCFRLRRQAPEDISVFELGHSFERLSSPVSISTSVKRIEPVRREMMLRTRLKQDQSSDDAISKSKADSTGEALQSSFLEGAELFEFELVGIVTARTEDVLKERLLNCKEAFSPLGDIQIETFGCLPTLTASFVGSPQHVPLLEMDQGLMAFLPVVANGESVDVRELQKRDLLLARKDRSLAQVDLLGKSHGNANALIIGHSGKGKSVFTGLLTTSLLNDPSTRVIKVDVGGSHSRECELLGGQEFAMSLNSPSGLNPFSIMDCGNSDENARAILGKFIEVLVTEDGEDIPPKIVRVEIDDLLKRYLAQSPKEASLGTFYDSCADFSRVALLSRWCGSGLYGKAFKSSSSANGNVPRLRYYNFSQIFHASDKDFAQAGMAAVLAQFNMEILKYPESRIVLICDEVPFFIHRCFDFFKFSMANVRKFGASVVLIVQLSQHLVKGEDTGLLDNAFHRFLFSIDGSPDDFKTRMGLKTDQVASIKGLMAIPGKRSEVLYQVGDETKTLVIELTPEEFWRVSSTQLDRIKIQKLREAIPELSLKEVLSCLALTS